MNFGLPVPKHPPLDIPDHQPAIPNGGTRARGGDFGCGLPEQIPIRRVQREEVALLGEEVQVAIQQDGRVEQIVERAFGNVELPDRLTRVCIQREDQRVGGTEINHIPRAEEGGSPVARVEAPAQFARGDVHVVHEILVADEDQGLFGGIQPLGKAVLGFVIPERRTRREVQGVDAGRPRGRG